MESASEQITSVETTSTKTEPIPIQNLTIEKPLENDKSPISPQIRSISEKPHRLDSPMRYDPDYKNEQKGKAVETVDETTEEKLKRITQMLSELSYKCKFHEAEKSIPYGLTFDDVLLIPQYSEINSRNDINIKGKFSVNIPLLVPFVSSPMDTVTEYEMAVAMARQGGLGIIHRFMTIREQADMVMKVKQTEAHVIPYPLCLHPSMTIGEVKKYSKEYKLQTFIVINERNSDWIPDIPNKEISEKPTLAGILTRRDLVYAKGDNQLISEIMTPREKMVVFDNLSCDNIPTPEYLIDKMKEKRVEKIVLLGKSNDVQGLVCMKDCLRKEERPWGSNLDKNGRLLVGAAVGAKDDYIERSEKLIEAGVDVLVVDVANGHSKLCIDAVKTLKQKFPKIDIVAGSVASGEAAELLIQAGADGIRCGIGNGSICITRVVAGSGIPQLSALFDVAPVCKKYGIPLISDGGNKNSGNMCKALAAGASSIMMGRLLAGCDESPSKPMYRDGKLVKVFRGMAGFGANVSKSQRMGISEPGSTNFTPEGVEGYIPYAGPLKDVFNQFAAGIRSGMSYSGATTLEALQNNAKFIRITQSGIRESGVHDITKIG